jgi:beta-carotene isomerase
MIAHLLYTLYVQTIAGPLVPPVYKTFMAPWPWAPFLTAFFTPPFFKFLVGPNVLSARSDDKVC